MIDLYAPQAQVPFRDGLRFVAGRVAAVLPWLDQAWHRKDRYSKMPRVHGTKGVLTRLARSSTSL